jgi:hypothetical protein
MTQQRFAEFQDGTFVRIWVRPERPPDAPHKGRTFHPVGAQRTGSPAGWKVVSGKAIETVAPAPDPSTDPNDYPLQPFQFFAMLEIMGQGMDPARDLNAEIGAAIDAIPDTATRAVARAKYEHIEAFHRDNPLFAQLAPTLGLSDAEIEAAWMQAKEIA